MSFRTVEVELENGFVRPSGAETLPAKARALLTVLDGTHRQEPLAPTGTEFARRLAELEPLSSEEAAAFAKDIEELRRQLPPLKSPWD